MLFAKRSLFFVLWLFAFALGMGPCIANDSVEFFILICSYNNAQWCKKNLDSVFRQTYRRWKIYYIDACSTDGTGEIVDAYIQKRGFSRKCTVVHKTTRTSASENFYYAIKDCDPHKVVVQLDGDDWLPHSRALEKVATAYKDPSVWMTYGSYRTLPPVYVGPQMAYPEDVKKDCSFRQYRWLYAPLRTFYAALFHKIPMEEFLDEGRFIKVTHDMAFGFPLLEMASKGHSRFIIQALYMYNYSNPMSDFRSARQEQYRVERLVRSRPSYTPLDTLF